MVLPLCPPYEGLHEPRRQHAKTILARQTVQIPPLGLKQGGQMLLEVGEEDLPPVGAQDAINAMNFCFGMMESAETGKVVKF